MIEEKIPADSEKLLPTEIQPSESNELYYLENGLLVFTKKFHLKRGYCCKNACRHCPFPK